MKAMVMHTFGDPDVMALEDIQLSAPGPGQALVKVMAAGINFMDTGTRRGLGAAWSLPLTPGVEGAGLVMAIGPGVRDVQPGDRVAWHYVPGSYAQQVLAPVSQLVPLPDAIDFDTAASVMMQGLTASNLVNSVYAVRPGDIAFVHAAAGGVGQMLTQLIKLRGGKVIGRVSQADKVDAVIAAGADYVVIGRASQVASQVLRLTEGQRVNVVYDGTGAEGFADSIELLDYFGTLALYGPFMNAIAPIDVFSLPRSIKLTYPSVMHYVRSREALLEHSRELFAWVLEGKLKTMIGRRYSLAQAAQAHRDIESRRTSGKLIINP
ncbi:NADPH2:quinone reductase [Pseudomonas sp. EB276 TE3739]|uniref:quinone oxidoreductase family protein n=1 Tax=Pseudomonas TaxID=286 RepID=UPI00209FF87D|nr:quinone oxidoreductase [Pseudomonas koreensis]MCP1475811.1 NADPH2:quinone reductase [Pseudomonas koreensis]